MNWTETLLRLNADASPAAHLRYLGSDELTPGQVVQTFVLGNGLTVSLLEDRRAPVVAYHTWYNVGSANEVPPKTGLAHFLEHLMFLQTESLGPGEMDRMLEELGAESNASTWLDWTQYSISVPSSCLDRVVELEAERMGGIVFADSLVASEREVVQNERRYRVDDDIDGAMNEVLWQQACRASCYEWPTIGWMRDIEQYTVADARHFYRRFYGPHNARVVVVGDFASDAVLACLQRAYARYPIAARPGDGALAPPQVAAEELSASTSTIEVVVDKWTPTAKVLVGYRIPGMSHPDHLVLGVLAEVLAGGAAARLVRKLVREGEIATDVRGSVSPLRWPGLLEFSLSGRPGVTTQTLLEFFDREVQAFLAEGPTVDELERARSRFELEQLHGMVSCDGRATSIGFHSLVVGDPAGGWKRLIALSRLSTAEVWHAAQHYLGAQRVVVRADAGAVADDEAQDEDETADADLSDGAVSAEEEGV